MFHGRKRLVSKTPNGALLCVHMGRYLGEASTVSQYLLVDG